MKKILIIDDERAIQILLSSRLKSEGFDVVKAGSGHQGLKIAQEEKPDLILLDLMMPEMDGYEFLNLIKSEHKDLQKIPILVLTARAANEDLERARQLGAAGALKKPFDPKILLEKVKELL